MTTERYTSIVSGQHITVLTLTSFFIVQKICYFDCLFSFYDFNSI